MANGSTGARNGEGSPFANCSHRKRAATELQNRVGRILDGGVMNTAPIIGEHQEVDRS